MLVLWDLKSLKLSGQLTLYCYECTSYEEGVDCTNYSTAVNYNCYDQLGDFTDGVAVTCYSSFINYTGNFFHFLFFLLAPASMLEYEESLFKNVYSSFTDWSDKFWLQDKKRKL